MYKKYEKNGANILAVLLAVAGFILLCRSERTAKEVHGGETLAAPAGYTLRNGAIDLQGKLIWHEPHSAMPLLQTEMNSCQTSISALPGGVLEFSVLQHRRKPIKLYLQGIKEGQILQLRHCLREGWIQFFWNPDAEPLNFPVRNFRLQQGRCRFAVTLQETACTMITIPLNTLYAGIFLLTAGIALGIIQLIGIYRHKNTHLRLKWAFYGTAAGFFTAGAIVLFHIAAGKNCYPFNTFLFRPGNWADDLFQSFACVRYAFMPYAWDGAGNYLPFTYILLHLFPSDRLDLLAALLYASFAAVLAFSAIKIIRPGNRFEEIAVLLLGFGNLPVLLLWNSGNLEMLIYILCFFFVITFQRYPLAAAVLLAMAINIKLYPGILGVLFLKRKDWKNAGICAALSLLFFLGSMNAMQWNFKSLFHALGNFSNIYLCYINDGLIFSHSLMSLYRYIGHHCFGLTAKGVLAAIPIYYGICLAIFAGILFLLFRRKYAFWQELYLLLGCAVLLPPLSFDYTLVLLLLPFWYFLREKNFQQRDKIYLFLWILIFIPENYYCSPLCSELQISVLIKPLALIATGILIGFDTCSADTSLPVLCSE